LSSVPGNSHLGRDLPIADPFLQNEDDPRIIAETRQYLRDFNRLDEATTTVRELYDAMLELYPIALIRALYGEARRLRKNG
jgi:hypothetical protein